MSTSTENESPPLDAESLGGQTEPTFLPRQTALSIKAREELERIVGDFSGKLEATARDIGRGMDEVQTPHVLEARNLLLASRISELANFSVVILLPIGLFILGIIVTPLIASFKSETGMHPWYVVAGIVGGGLFVGSVALYMAKSPLIKFFAKKSQSRSE